MADYISNWAVKLTANASGLVQGLDVGAAKMQAFAKQTLASTKLMTSGVNSALQAVTGTNVAAALGPLSGVGNSILGLASTLATAGPAGAIAAVASAAVSAAGAVASFGVSSINSIGSAARLANRIGLTTQEMLGLREVAQGRGLSFDDMNDGINGYARNLAKLHQEIASGQAGPIVNALGTIGINAAEFARLPVAAQFAQLSAGLNGVQDGMQRLALARAILGRGVALERMLGADPSAFTNLSNVAGAAGLQVSQGQSASILSASNAFRAFSQVFQNTVNSIQTAAAVVFAPFASFFTTTLTAAVTALAPVFRMLTVAVLGVGFGYIIAGMMALAAAVQFVMPVLRGIGGAFDIVWKAITKVWDAMTPVIGLFAQMIGTLFGGFGIMSAWGEGFQNVGNFIASGILGAAAIVARVVSSVSTSLSGVVRMAATAAAAISVLEVAAGGTADTALQTRLLQISGDLQTAGIVADNAARRLQSTNLNAQQVNAGPQLAGANPEWSTRLQQLQQERAQIGLTTQELERQRAISQGLTPIQAAAVVAQIARNEHARTEATFAEQTRNLQEQAVRAQADGAAAQEIALARHRGVSEELIRQREIMQAAVADAERLQRLRQQATQTAQQLRNPGEQFNARIAELRDMLNEGGLGIGDFNRGVAGAFNQLMQAAPQQPADRSPQAALAGSVEEQRAIVRAQQQDQQSRMNPQERVRQVLEQMRLQEERQMQLMQDLLGEARNGFIGRAG